MKSGGRGPSGSQVKREGVGVGVGVGGGEKRQEEETRDEKWSWASRVRQRSPVPDARPREKKEVVEAVRSLRERRRGRVTRSSVRIVSRNDLAGRRDRDAGEEGKVAGSAGTTEGVSRGGWRSLRAARVAGRCSALLTPLGLLTLPSATGLYPPQLRR
ncbi:hypothetical protein HJG60_012184 [Phyllostomus discolor]|uniref:Uncharacterized protein n=1 Tax=Phyllostomus discolor TaxID=89673 RepID=A0A833ZH83_9CHIR|nr:hypothetical protein HJG60_012184 [Phyllostomus discolor]